MTESTTNPQRSPRENETHFRKLATSLAEALDKLKPALERPPGSEEPREALRAALPTLEILQQALADPGSTRFINDNDALVISLRRQIQDLTDQVEDLEQELEEGGGGAAPTEPKAITEARLCAIKALQGVIENPRTTTVQRVKASTMLLQHVGTAPNQETDE
ncbi:MAG: hypothetical protein ACK5QX_04990 [bacterium]